MSDQGTILLPGQLGGDDQSVAERLARLEPDERRRLLEPLTEGQIAALRYDWGFWSRPDQQLPLDPWLILALLGGRGSGKTRGGAEGVRVLARQPNTWGAFVAPTPKDARDLMIEGPSGVLACSTPEERPIWEPSKNRLTWPNGTIATVYSAADPEAIRGPNFHWAWCDEMGKWRFMQRAWDNLRFALRAGDYPQTIITTTPTGHPLIRRILSGEWDGTEVRRVSTYRNAANLAATFLQELLRQYEGTRLGLQELWGQVLDEIEGALWTLALIERWRWHPTENQPAFTVPMQRIVVGVDPSGSKRGAEAGVVVCGLGYDRRGYVLEDCSLRGSPAEWGRAAVDAYRRWNADRIVAETNFGADMVRDTITAVDSGASYKDVHASRGKAQRAEPVVALYEQGRISHVGTLGLLETELTQWVPPGTINQAGEDIGSTWSPGRLDATVWALTELMIDGSPSPATATAPAGPRLPTGVRSGAGGTTPTLASRAGHRRTVG
ncbi:MAG: hypothetical protein SHS37scaffold145_77 [Phage 71_18]|nr:MAG: hypothetical protein SHS37scaffold145_77 [Phage 71_18]